jgi:spore maturation protein CgeB
VSGQLRIRIFAHSWISDWNHGNAHFLRGLAQELTGLGHEVRCYEELNCWSVNNLLQEDPDRASQSIFDFWRAFQNLDVRFYAKTGFSEFAEGELREADIVIVHEWNDPYVVHTILSLKRKLGFRVLLHDTHHRAYTNPKEISRFPLHQFDGVLAFGEALRQIYLQAFKVKQAWTFHEAADVRHFQPLPAEKDTDIIWVGNWGDEERTRELQQFLIGPAAAMADRKVAVHGVRYPSHARRELAQAGIEFRGYLPNLEAPNAYAKSRLTLHVPRKFYSNGLSGVPTIRVFEALACGIPLLCSPWSDVEHLFRPGEDYVCVEDGDEMRWEICHLLHDEAARRQIAANGRKSIQERHTCRHRALQLMEICEELGR